MANKYYRQNFNKGGRAPFRMGTKNSFDKEEREVQKKVDRDALVFGAKKAIERAKNKENKLAKMKQVFDSKTNKNIFATDSQIMNNPDRFKPIRSMIKMLKADDKAKADKRVMDYMKSKEPDNPRFSEKDIELAKKALGMKKGGRAALKRGGGKFPDYSGDGKITMRDILMGRGVIPKKNKKKMMAKKFKSPMEKAIKGKKA